MKLDEAKWLVHELIEMLRPGCERIEEAGSVRRGTAEPNDLEVVCIPRWEVLREFDLFGQVMRETRVCLLDDALEHAMPDYGPWMFDTETPRNGPKYKRLRHSTRGVCCDLFITSVQHWGVIYTIRTGPSAYSKMLVTIAQKRGWFVDGGMLHQHGRPSKQLPDGTWKPLPCPQGDECTRVASTPEEVDFFRVLGVPWLEPDKRMLGKVVEYAR